MPRVKQFSGPPSCLADGDGCRVDGRERRVEVRGGPALGGILGSRRRPDPRRL